MQLIPELSAEGPRRAKVCCPKDGLELSTDLTGRFLVCPKCIRPMRFSDPQRLSQLLDELGSLRLEGARFIDVEESGLRLPMSA